jgi:MoaA/NifB/PqqE/SkfB family radical SAM enzyme
MTMAPESHEDYQSILQRVRSRPLYLWGAAQTGIGVLHALSRLGIRPAGFIDRRKQSFPDGVGGVPVFTADEVLSTERQGPRPFIINTTTLYADQVAGSCVAAGLRPSEDFISYEVLCPCDFQVIVSSTCNLRCVSCPVGNRPQGMASGFMAAADYAKVLDKILSEVPLLSTIQLFNWGEPFLNPDLARIVEITNERGVLCSLSSNMNLHRGFEDVIAAKPAFLRISLSGNEGTYSVTHTGGKWDLFLKNIQTLHDLTARYNPGMVVEAAYHVYATTTQQDVERARSLCASLGIVFRPHLAALLPLDNVLDYMEGTPLTAEAMKTVGMLRIPIDEALARSRKERTQQCSFERTLNIESDLSVKQCGLWIRPGENRVVDNFLDIPFDRIAALRRAHPLCPFCKARGLHRFCSVYTGDASDLAAQK